MNFTDDIFKKATVRGIADYLQFGLAPQKETRDYNTREYFAIRELPIFL